MDYTHSCVCCGTTFWTVVGANAALLKAHANNQTWISHCVNCNPSCGCSFQVVDDGIPVEDGGGVKAQSISKPSINNMIGNQFGTLGDSPVVRISGHAFDVPGADLAVTFDGVLCPTINVIDYETVEVVVPPGHLQLKLAKPAFRILEHGPITGGPFVVGEIVTINVRSRSLLASGPSGSVHYVSTGHGASANDITVSHAVGAVGGGEEDRVLAVAVASDAITVTFGTDGSGDSVVPTAGAVEALVNGDGPASAKVVATAEGDGTGIVAETAATNLSGGTSQLATGLVKTVDPEFLEVDELGKTRGRMSVLVGGTSGAQADLVSDIAMEFALNETILGELSGATAVISKLNPLSVDSVSGTFTPGEIIAGQSSGARSVTHGKKVFYGWVHVAVSNTLGRRESGAVSKIFEYRP